MQFKLLTSAVLLALANHAEATPFFLSCNMVFQYDGTPVSNDFKIDEESRTVNGLPAQFSESAITYKFPTKSGEMWAVFSRITGRVTVSTESGEIVAQGTCAISNTRKF